MMGLLSVLTVDSGQMCVSFSIKSAGDGDTGNMVVCENMVTFRSEALGTPLSLSLFTQMFKVLGVCWVNENSVMSPK
jgi:hypothetical protein